MGKCAKCIITWYTAVLIKLYGETRKLCFADLRKNYTAENQHLEGLNFFFGFSCMFIHTFPYN